MSGQPNRYSTSAATYRQQYMDALGVRASLDDQVLQAVKVYKQTGQLPAVSSMPDNRTSAEKLADTQGLKVKLIAELKPIIDSQGAQAIVQGIERSPLNGDGSLFSFFAQRIKAIVKQLSDQYGIGIKGDTNDIQTFIRWVEEFYAKTKDSLTTAKSYFDTYTAAGGITAAQIDTLTSEYLALVPKLLAKFGGRVGGRDGGTREKVQEFGEYLNLISHIITRIQNTALQEAAILANTQEVTGGIAGGIDLIHDAIIKFKDFQEQLPTLASIRAVLKQIYNTLPNRSPALLMTLVNNLISLFPPIEELAIVQGALDRLRPGPGPGPGDASSSSSSSSSGQPPFPGVGSVSGSDSSSSSSSSSSSGGSDEARQILGQYFPGMAPHTPSVSDTSSSSDGHHHFDDLRSRAKRVETLKRITGKNTWTTGSTDARDWIERINGMIDNKADLPDVLSELTNEELVQTYVDCAMLPSTNPNVASAIYQAATALGVQVPGVIGGEGIKRRRGRPKGCGIKVPFAEKVDSSQGVQASPRYISFGKHVINKKKLGDGILSIRTKSGANIAATPVKHISKNLKCVVDKIIGGAIPSYEELSKLTEEEKSYLHRVSKQADILDKFSIPAPSKDQEEKEIHEYEVMRGEIMSGNDNKELIKKFKLLIIKLSRRGALPKKEVSDILSELIELGY